MITSNLPKVMAYEAHGLDCAISRTYNILMGAADGRIAAGAG
jgi:hypothetical protein